MTAWSDETHIFLTLYDRVKVFLPLEDTGGVMFREGIHKWNITICKWM